MGTKVGIFDLGKTVIDYDWERAVGILERRYGVDPKRVYGTIIHNDAYEGLEAGLYDGTLSPNEFYRSCMALFQKQGEGRWPAKPVVRMTEERFWEICNSIFMPNPPMEGLIPLLKVRGYRLILLTNTCAPHLEFIRRTFRVMDNFDATVASHEVKVEKPDPVMYPLALEAAQARPEECFFVDDLAQNLAYAQVMGIRTFRYDIGDHDALLEWLSREQIL